MLGTKVLVLVLLATLNNNLCLCDSDEFQANVDGFIDAFDDAYSTENISPTTDEIDMKNDIGLDTSNLGGEISKQNEGEPVLEEAAVTETVFHPGSDVKHELTEDVRALAERVVTSINPQLKLVNVTEAISTVTDKIQRSLWLVVARQECEDASCTVFCRVDVVSHDSVDEVTWHNCMDTPSSNEVIRKKRGAIGGFKEVDEAEARELADIAAQTLDSIDADDTKRVVTQVIRAQKQLVNGIMYHLTLEIASSDCKEDEEKCESKLSDHNICKILMQRLFSGEAPHNAQVIKSECTPISKAKELNSKKRVRRHVDGSESNMISEDVFDKKTHPPHRLVGGKTRQDPNSDRIKEISTFALAEIDKASNSLNKQQIVRVVDARSQVVAGVKYFLKLELVETNCRKGSDQEVCKPNDNQVMQSCDVTIWDKPWEKFRTITRVNCTPLQRRTKRALVGSYNPADPNDASIQEIAKFAVSQLDAKSNSLNSQKLLIIKKAETQVVAGKNYRLKIQLVETNCRKGSKDEGECTASPDKVVQECDVVVYDRPWDHHREMTSANCYSANNKQVNKRSLVGGYSQTDPNDVRVQEMASFAVSQLDAKSNSLNSQKLLLVKEAHTQVVAGTNYKLKIQLVETNCRKGSQENRECTANPDKTAQECEVVVYDRPWDQHREMTSANCPPVSNNIRVNKRDVLVGGLSPADKESAEAKDMAQFAIEDHNRKSNSMYKKTLVEVVSVHTQVVAGQNFYIKLRVAESECKDNDSALKSSTCIPKKDSAHQDCEVVVWSQPWLDRREVTKFECRPTQNEAQQVNPSQTQHITAKSDTATHPKPVHRRGLMTGGHTPADKDSQEIQEVAQFAIEDLNKKSNSMYKQALVEVISAHTQVVAGINYHLKLRVAETECKKNEKKSVVCEVKGNAVHQECDVTVWSRPWLNERQVTKSVCKQVQDNQTVAELKPADTLARDVLEAASFSLRAIDRSSNSMYKHALTRVLDAKVQTVSGKKYFLTLEIAESECTKHQAEEGCSVRSENSLSDKCRVIVWDRPWLKKKEVLNVTCGLRSKRSVGSQPNDVDIMQRSMFEQFKIKYNKEYRDEVEHQKRFRIFRANLKKIRAFQENEQGTAVYGPNMFSDLTAKEFRQKYLGLKSGPGPKPSKHHMIPAQIPDVPLPTDFDWRDHNAVTPVKNQGQCGSCWAFSVTGNIEGQWALKHGKLLSLSEQELVDCDKTDSGCNGGYMTSAYEAIEKLGGLETEEEYPYDAQDETCKFNQSEVQATVASSLNITSNETQMAQWLFANGPISIGINANAMQFYMGGVSHPYKFLCSKSNLDHGVLLVGFGVHRTSIRHKLLPYWLIKNSWGPRWGEKGYYRVYRGDGTCGVNQMASSAVVG